MRVGIVGAGAIGSTIGGLLARAGHDVVLLGRAAHVAAIARDGLHLRGPDERLRIDVAATDDATTLPTCDVLVMTCKAHATAVAIAEAGHALADDGLAVTVQNGLGNDRVLAEAVGMARTVAGTTTVGAMRVEPGVVDVAPATMAGQSQTHVAPAANDTGPPPLLRRWATAMDDAGLPTIIGPVDRVVWTKLAVAGSMGPLTAVLDCTIRDVTQRPSARRLWRAMVEEVVAVADAEGASLDLQEVWAHCTSTAAGVGPHVTSMLADLRADRPTEADAMVVQVLHRARAHDVATPTLTVIADLLIARDRHAPDRLGT